MRLLLAVVYVKARAGLRARFITFHGVAPRTYARALASSKLLHARTESRLV
jgi:hypothetical protein